MSSENENIEAKLCSYVEGDLDAAGRAEIEKYLVANPQYKPLIAELSRTRGMLRALPRDSAPAELLETLHGQLERSALLGDDEVEGGSEMRISRWPHLTAWAAVLLLTTGLAAVIYRVLPSNKTQPELAFLRSAPADAPAATMAADAPALKSDQLEAAKARGGSIDAEKIAAELKAADDKLAMADKVGAGGGAAPTIAPPVSNEPAPVQNKFAMAKAQTPMDRDAGLPPAPMTNGYVTNNTTNAGVPERRMLAETLGTNSKSGAVTANRPAAESSSIPNVYFVLRSNDTVATHGQVAAYMNVNGIPYQTVPGPAASLSLQAQPQQQVASQGSSVSTGVLTLTPTAAPAPAAPAATTSPAAAVAQEASAGEAFEARKRTSKQAAPMQQAANSDNYPQQTSQQTAPQQDMQSQSAGANYERQVPAGANNNNDGIAPVIDASALPVAAEASDVIIARNLTRQQAQNLGESLGVASQQFGMQQTHQLEATKEIDSRRLNIAAQAPIAAAVVEQQPAKTNAATTAPTTLPSGPLAAGDTVRIAAADIAVKDVEAMNEQQTVDADGNITLPLLGKLKAAGLTEAELQQAIPLAFKQARSPTEATWKVERLGRGSGGEPVVIEGIATTQPATQPASGANAEALGDRVDVMILVCKPAAPATGPTAEAAPNAAATASPTATQPAVLDEAVPTTVPAK